MEAVQLDASSVGPGPVQHPEASAFWSRVGNGELCLQVCDRCRTVRFPVLPVCFVCSFPGSSLVPVSGRGRVAVVVTVHVATGGQEWAGAVPYVSGLVDMEGGARLPGRVLCTCGEPIEKGTVVDAVRVPSRSGSDIYAFAHQCVTTSLTE